MSNNRPVLRVTDIHFDIAAPTRKQRDLGDPAPEHDWRERALNAEARVRRMERAINRAMGLAEVEAAKRNSRGNKTAAGVFAEYVVEALKD